MWLFNAGLHHHEELEVTRPRIERDVDSLPKDDPQPTREEIRQAHIDKILEDKATLRESIDREKYKRGDR